MGFVCHEEGLGEGKEEAKSDGGRDELLVRVVGWTFWRRLEFVCWRLVCHVFGIRVVKWKESIVCCKSRLSTFLERDGDELVSPSGISDHRRIPIVIPQRKKKG